MNVSRRIAFQNENMADRILQAYLPIKQAVHQYESRWCNSTSIQKEKKFCSKGYFHRKHITINTQLVGGFNPFETC